MWIRAGCTSRPHSHSQVEVFELIKGKAQMDTPASRTRMMRTETVYRVPSRSRIRFRALEQDAYIYFAFPYYRSNWSNIRYSFSAR